MDSLLLDTCAIIYWMNGDLKTQVEAQLMASGLAQSLFVSPVSAWEVGLLGLKPGNTFIPSPRGWFARVLASPIVQLAPLTPEVAIASSYLPGDLHRDPADRLLVAAARDLGAALVTSDRRLLAYAAQGHMRALAC